MQVERNVKIQTLQYEKNIQGKNYRHGYRIILILLCQV